MTVFFLPPAFLLGIPGFGAPGFFAESCNFSHECFHFIIDFFNCSEKTSITSSCNFSSLTFR